MNENHTRLCGGSEWAQHLHNDVLPAVTVGVALGAELLELGPGPGAATDWLRARVARVVALEHDKSAADALAQRVAHTNVEVVHGDATALGFTDVTITVDWALRFVAHAPRA